MNHRCLAIVLSCLAGSACAADLGRMFFTPSQRAALDDARRKSSRGEVVGESRKAEAPPQNVSVSGLVRRSDGKSTIWVNSQPVTEKQTGSITIAPAQRDGQVRLTVPESGRSVDLKVGQSVEVLSGTIEESYARRVPASPAPGAPTPEGRASDAGKTPAPAVRSEGIRLRRPARTREGDIQDDQAGSAGRK